MKRPPPPSRRPERQEGLSSWVWWMLDTFVVALIILSLLTLALMWLHEQVR
jgi:hypothetical protein